MQKQGQTTEAGHSCYPVGSVPHLTRSHFRMSLSHKDRESLLLDVFLVSRSWHGLGPPSLLFVTYITLKRKRKIEYTPHPGL